MTLSVPTASVENISVGTSSIAANLQELSLIKDHGALSAEESTPVTIPKHLQVSDADLLRFKFGSFDAEELRKILRPQNTQPNHHQPCSRSQNYDQLRSLSDEGVASTPDVVLSDFGSSSMLQPEIARTESLDLEHGPHYNFPSVSGYSFFLPGSVGIGPESYLQLQNPYPASDLVRLYTSPLSSSPFATQPAENFYLSDLFQPSIIISTRRHFERRRPDTTSSHSTQQSTMSMGTRHMRPQSMSMGTMPRRMRPQSTMSMGTRRMRPQSTMGNRRMRPQHLPVNRNSQPTLSPNFILPFQPQSNSYPYRLPSTSTQQEVAIASGLSGSEIPSGIPRWQTALLNPSALAYTPLRHNQPSTMQSIMSMDTSHMRPHHLPVNRNSQPTLFTNFILLFQPQSNAYPYRLPTTSTQQEAAVASGLSGSEIPIGTQRWQTTLFHPSAPAYTPWRHNQPSTMQLTGWNYYIPQQSFPRPMAAMLAGMLSDLPTEYEEHQGNLSSGSSNHFEDSQSDQGSCS